MTEAHATNDTTSSLTDPASQLRARFRSAFQTAFGPEFAETDPFIKPTQNPKFGDFQSNVAMPLSKRLKQNPREIAQQIINHLNVSDLCETPIELAGPGFINLTIQKNALASMLGSLDEKTLGVSPIHETKQHRIVVDMVSVNVAKQMHVGHLRSAIIGDTLCRILNRVGYDVIPQNHLGDWGLQIAMVLADLRERKVNLDNFTVAELEHAYRSANLDCRADRRALELARELKMGPHRLIECEEQVAGADVATDRAKTTLVKLQQGDESVVADWHKIIRITLADCYDICSMLGLQLNEEHERGESFYREMLPEIVREFQDSKLAEIDDGALIVRTPDSETPLLIRKSDGGFLYATTDLAGVKYRVKKLGAERLIYIVDARQRDHFKLVFAACRLIGYDVLPPGHQHAGERAELIHIPFGAVCGTDGRPLKTRTGENVKLRDLLEEAVRRAREIVSEKNPDLDPSEQENVARAVGIGAVKYADLSSHLGRDYLFDWKRMLAFEGNTGAYLQNQYVRIRSIERKASSDSNSNSRSVSDSKIRRNATIFIDEPAEKTLALEILRYASVVCDVAQTLEPHRLCQYLYGLANAFSVFYTKCSVLNAPTSEVRDSRLQLCRLTAAVLGDGLDLLGIRTLQRM